MKSQCKLKYVYDDFKLELVLHLKGTFHACQVSYSATQVIGRTSNLHVFSSGYCEGAIRRPALQREILSRRRQLNQLVAYSRSISLLLLCLLPSPQTNPSSRNSPRFNSWFRLTTNFWRYPRWPLHESKRMGLPMGKLVISANSNDILARFWRSGRYE